MAPRAYAWFFETVVLMRRVPGYAPFNAAFQFLFNSYYEALGRAIRGRNAGCSRARRSTRCILPAIRRRRDAPRPGWRRCGVARGDHARAVLGLHHEQQHQELIVTDMLHAFSCNPLKPAFRPRNGRTQARWLRATPARSTGCISRAAVEIGHDGEAFSFDNERPRHTALVRPYEIANRLVTNAEFAAFVADGGYTPEFWLSDGWATVQRKGGRRVLDARRRRCGRHARAAHVRPARRRAARTRRAGVPRELLRSGRVCGMGGRAPADRIRMGSRVPRRGHPADARARVAMDALVLRAVPGISAARRGRRRIQRQVHGRPASPARQQHRNAARARTADVPLSASRALAIHGVRLARDV